MEPEVNQYFMDGTIVSHSQWSAWGCFRTQQRWNIYVPLLVLGAIIYAGKIPKSMPYSGRDRMLHIG